MRVPDTRVAGAGVEHNSDAQMSVVLVTGGSGFIGTSVVEYHCALGDDVYNVDLVQPRNPQFHPHWIHVDIRHAEALVGLVHKIQPEYVYHLAARTDFDGTSLADYDSNTVGVANLIGALTTAPRPVQRTIYASSRFVCPVGYTPTDEYDYRPDTFYGESKVAGEKLVRDRAGDAGEWTIVRPTSIWGPWFGTPFREFFRAVSRGLYVHPANKEVFKSLGYVGNTVLQLYRLMLAPASLVARRMFYSADYDAVEIGSFADRIRDAFGAGGVRRVPMAMLRLMALAGDGSRYLGIRHPPLTSYRLGNMTTNALYDISPLKGVVGDLPYSLQDGIERTVRWVHEQDR